jgi:DNA (cytosine-5)-methyltransferase 1
VLDLFSGIGGFSLGLKRAGMKTVAFCEIEPYPRAVLRKHWPEVPCYDDIRTLTATRLAADGIDGIDIICGGFPCQNISLAGKGAGLAGKQSGLWFEYLRLITEIHPQAAIIENSPALRNRGLDQMLGALAALGYDAEWHCVPASALGAPHERDRIWIVANAQTFGRGSRRQGRPFDAFSRLRDEARRNAADPYKARLAFGQGFSGHAFTQRAPLERDGHAHGGTISIWPDEPALCGVDDGIPCRLDRIAALGNAVIPQIPEMIGRAIMENWHAGNL